jgi:hypothetical protein
MQTLADLMNERLLGNEKSILVMAQRLDRLEATIVSFRDAYQPSSVPVPDVPKNPVQAASAVPSSAPALQSPFDARSSGSHSSLPASSPPSRNASDPSVPEPRVQPEVYLFFVGGQLDREKFIEWIRDIPIISSVVALSPASSADFFALSTLYGAIPKFAAGPGQDRDEYFRFTFVERLIQLGIFRQNLICVALEDILQGEPVELFRSCKARSPAGKLSLLLNLLSEAYSRPQAQREAEACESLLQFVPQSGWTVLNWAEEFQRRLVCMLSPPRSMPSLR